jgi:DNA adenine methylase
MKIRGIAPWFGGKRTLAPRIVEQLGEHERYFEPYCGSVAVLLCKPPSRYETLNDLHCDLINLALVIQSPNWGAKLYERLSRALVCDALLAEAEGRLAEPFTRPAIPGGSWAGMETEHTCERAYWYFVACWMARNGVAGTAETNYQLAVRWTGGGGSPTVRWRSATESIPAWHQRLQNTVILNRRAEDIIPKFEDAVATAIYIDPPYPHETRGARSAGTTAHSSRYLHDFGAATDGLFGSDDHAQLAEMLRAFDRARIVVSTYDCPRMRELYDGWTVIECPTHKHLAAQNTRGSRSRTVAPEILLLNGPSF